MGAYGRSAWREFVLGGATRSVIRHLDMPVLMAH
jgi:nucleotide-binding universal stress UspA family protein